MLYLKGAEMNNEPESWIEQLQMLVERFSHLGIAPDLSELTIIEQRGIYRFLLRLAGEQP